jgi:hypothetical protein
MSVALVIRHGSACTVLSSVVRLAIPYFSTLSHRLHDFRGEKCYWTKKYVLIFSTKFFFSETFLTL